MRTILAGLLLACLWQSVAFAQCAPAPDSAYFFRNLSESRAEAKIAADRAVYDKQLSAAFESKTADGKTLSKDDYIAAELAANHADPSRRFYSIANYTLVEHRQGHTVATYLLREGTTDNGVTHMVELQLRETYEVEGGKWRLSSVEVAPANASTRAQAAR
jgi:hypothetical protein